MHRNVSKRKSHNFLISVVLFLLLVFATFIICKQWKFGSHSGKDLYQTDEKINDTETYDDTLTSNNVDSLDGSNDNVTSDNVNNENKWNLTLVNRWNPISDNVNVDIVRLSNGECVDRRIYPYLQQMFDDMRTQGIYPVVASGYRTEEEQQQMYDDKVDEYVAQGYSIDKAKELTEQWVALPGTSEHQLGLGVDINADGVHSYGDEVYTWLLGNAHLYGFIKRYPDDKTKITGISNEPWHYRYVGIDAATEIHERGICLEEYLGRTE